MTDTLAPNRSVFPCVLVMQLDLPKDRDLQDLLPAADFLLYEPTLAFSNMQDAVAGLGMTYTIAGEAQFNA